MSQAKKSDGVDLDLLLAQWRRERPDLDCSPMAVVGAVWRANEILRQGVLTNLSPAGLDLAGFDVLLTLRRQGRDQSLSPSALAKEIMLSTSAMTNRLDRLEKKGLIKRCSDPQDRRGLRIVLTEAGFELADRLVAGHLRVEQAMLADLDEDERVTLRRLLEKINST